MLYLECKIKYYLTGVMSLIVEGKYMHLEMYLEQIELKSLRHCSDAVTLSKFFPELKQEIHKQLLSNPDK